MTLPDSVMSAIADAFRAHHALEMSVIRCENALMRFYLTPSEPGPERNKRYEQAIEAYNKHGNGAEAATALGLTAPAFWSLLSRAKHSLKPNGVVKS